MLGIVGRTGVGTVVLWLGGLTVFFARGDVNVAPGKSYSQSSTYNKGHTQRGPDAAANGDTSGHYPANCIHTREDEDHYKDHPWYEVNLGRTYPLHRIDLWARGTFKHRLYPSTITVDNKTCTTVTTYNTTSRKEEVTCSAIVYGQRVRITLENTTQSLNLCEMKIWVPDGVSHCSAGKYGSSCDLNCSENCGQGLGKNFCDESSAKCYGGCVDGRYGKLCDRLCPAANCQQCEQDTGECTQCALDSNLLLPNCTGCVAGWYGDQCSTACSPGCANQQCSQESGECSPCNTGYTGDTCTDCQDNYYQINNGTCALCSSSCQSQSCTSPTGRCNGCVDGRYGEQCDRLCPAANCQQCEQDTGECTQCELDSNLLLPNCTDCPDNFYERPNNTGCDNCTWSCQSGTVCDKTTGHCPVCPPGKHGHHCDEDCQNKTYGQNCVKTCGQCRGGQPCDPVTGQCSNGCQPGWTDLTPSSTPLCQTECPDGTYGNECSQKCGSCAQLSECRHDKGQCSGQWASGFTGSHLEKGDNAGVIAGPVVAVLIVVLIAVIVVIFVVRRRRQRAKSNALPNESAESCNNTSGGAVRTPPASSGSSLLTFDAISSRNDKKDGRPQSQGKPSVSAKPHPAGADIYQNVSLADQNWVLKAAIASPKQASDKSGSGNSGKGPPGQTARPPPGADTSRLPGREPLTDDEELDSMWSGEPVYANDPSYVNFQPAKYCLDQLHETILDSLRDGRPDREFGLLVGLKDFPLTNGQRQENYYKNRFKRIVPYDKNRVVLEKMGGDDASDYVNASIIKGYRTEKAYIASQGPRSNTQDDFWRMVWQEGVTDIVMLTNVKEGNKHKCHEYWPEKGKSLNTGHVEVTGLQEKERANFVIRSFTVTNLQSNDKRQVRQYHYLKWMDHEVPATTPLVDFWRYVRARAPRTSTAPPLVVHCSAGVGRTGTYIALDILMDQTQEEEEISLFRTVDSLREDRCHMVQNKGQYEFLHEAVVEAYLSGDCRQDTSSFDRLFPHTVHHHLPHPRLDAEFERLCQMRAYLPPPSHTVASLEENRQKNRNPEALPDNKHLVYITEHTKGRNQYINAVYMPTFLSSLGSIVTQLPLADTVIDLWRLVDSWDVTTVVSIGQGDGDKDICRYWPKGKEEPVQCGPYTISLKSTSSLGGSLVSHTLDMKKKDTSREVQVLHYEAWTGEVAGNVSDLLHLLDILHTSHEQSTEEPIMIQCIDGVAKSGVLCALWDVISRMTYDDDVDVFLAARHVHTVRPEAISSVVQYRFIYEVIQQYRNSKNIYANTSSLSRHQ